MSTTGRMVRVLEVCAISVLLGGAAALAHGAPTLSAKENVVSAGGKVTLSGDALGEKGDSVTLVLRGASYQAQLGTVRLESDGFDDTQFAIPSGAPPGTYAIFAQNGKIAANAQVEVAAAAAPAGQSQGVNPMPASPSVPGQAGISVPRARSPFEWTVAIGLVVLTGGLAVVLLWRSSTNLI